MTRIRAIASGRRAWAARLSVLVAVGALVGLIVAIVPALAGHGTGSDIPPASTTHNVTPTEVNLGGQPNDCSATEVGLGHLYDFRIVDPATGTYTDSQSGITVTFQITEYKVAGEEFIDWTLIGGSVEGLVIKGGDNSAFYHYEPAVGGDTGAHATLKNNDKLHQVSHASFCYDITGTVSGMKWHDHDTDGAQDPTDAANEPGLGGWTINLYDAAASLVDTTPTAANGTYSFSDVPLGDDYTVCEVPNDSTLPSSGTGFSWSWAQSDQSSTYSTWSTGICGGNGEEANGHAVTLNASTAGLDFGNHLMITLQCGATATLGGSTGTGGIPGVGDNPLATVTMPSGTACTTEDFTSSFDVGLSTDPGDAFRQFVVFGAGTGTAPIAQTIVWSPEVGDYTTNPPFLTIPTTQVIIPPSSTPEPVVFCSTLGGAPTTAKPDCLVNRTIAEGTPLPTGLIQLTENYLFLGDPPRFR